MLFFRKNVNKQYVEVMGNGQDKNQETQVVAERGDELGRCAYRLPGLQLQKGVAYVEQVIGNKQNVVNGVGPFGIAVEELQYEDAAVAVEYFTQPVDNVECRCEVNDVCKNIAVHKATVCAAYLIHYPFCCFAMIKV